jgi:hypothetical protein
MTTINKEKKLLRSGLKNINMILSRRILTATAVSPLVEESLGIVWSAPSENAGGRKVSPTALVAKTILVSN